MKSMLLLSPRMAKKPMKMSATIPQMVNDLRYMPMKLTFMFCSRFFDRPVVKVRLSHLSFFMRFSYTRRVRNTAVKNEQQIPMIRVMAKPFTGPIPMTARMIPVMIEVRLESKMAEKALL